MKKNNTNRKKLVGYSAMAAAFIGAGTSADAQIVYVDITDVTLDLGFFIAPDMDGDGTADFVFQVASSSGAPWTFVNGFGNLSSIGYGGPNNAMVGYDGAVFPYASALDSGASIGPAANFLTSTNNVAFFASIYSGVTYGDFADVTDKYLGVKFDIGGETHYGWFRLDVTVGPVSLTIKDWAYNDTPNEMIAAGDMGGGAALIAFTDDASTVNEGVGAVPIAVAISEDADCSIGVEINGALTTALEGADFNFVDPSPITFVSGGPTTASFDVNIFDDAEFEIPETITFDLVDLTGTCALGDVTSYTLTINDNDAPPAVSFVGATETTNEIASNIPITVHISDTYDCTVEVSLNAGLTTATEGSDFTFSAPSPIIFIGGGPVSHSFDVTIIDDAEFESLEDIVFDLISPAGCILGAPVQTVIHILENDAPIPDPSYIAFENISASIEEETTPVTISLTIDAAADCSVDVSLNTALSTASEGPDFVFDSPQTLNFTSGGATTASFNMQINEDFAVEGDESIFLELTNVTGDCALTTGGDLMEYKIIDDDQVGINALEAAGINLYSSENTIYIALNSNPKNTAIQVLDATGKLVYTAQVESKEQSFTIKNIAEGIYFCKLNVDGKIYEKKVWMK